MYVRAPAFASRVALRPLPPVGFQGALQGAPVSRANPNAINATSYIEIITQL